MIVNGKEYDMKSLVENLDTVSNSFVKVGNLMLTKREIDILKRNFIDYETANSLKDLMIKIQAVFEDESIDPDDAYELEYVLDNISERDYYDYKKR